MTTAYAGSILWATTHSSTNLVKHEELLLSSTTEEGEDIEDDIEDTASDIDDPEADSVEFIDFIDTMIVGKEMEPMEPTDPPMESISTKQEEIIHHPEEGVEEMNDPIEEGEEKQIS